MTVAPPVDARPGRPALRRGALQRGTLLQNAGPSLALLVVVLVFAALSTQFRTVGNAQNILDAAAVLAVVTCGTTFVLLLGSIDLSAAGVMAASSLTVALLVENTRNDVDTGPAGIAVAILLAAALGCASGLLLVTLKVPSFITTLGTSAVGLGLATLLFSGVQPGVVDAGLRSWATGRFLGFTYLTWIAVVCVAAGWLVQRYTRLGRYTMAIGGAEEVLSLSGVRVAPYKVAVFTLAGAFYGLAAVMVTSQLGSGVVQAGAQYSFSAITAAVVGGTLLTGGRGGVLHSTVGVLLLAVLANGLVLVGVSPYVQGGVQGLIVVVAVAIAAIPLRHRNQVVK